MALRQPIDRPATGPRRAPLPSGGARVGALAALLGAGLLAATALASSHSARAQPQGPTITSATTATTTTGIGSPGAPKGAWPNGAWMTFEANPVSLALRPLRRFAACVRRHGVQSLPDPKVMDGKVVLMLPRALTTKSPRLKNAQHACRRLLPQGANTQPGTRTAPTTTLPGG
jgi:hypothetical protein